MSERTIEIATTSDGKNGGNPTTVYHRDAGQTLESSSRPLTGTPSLKRRKNARSRSASASRPKARRRTPGRVQGRNRASRGVLSTHRAMARSTHLTERPLFGWSMRPGDRPLWVDCRPTRTTSDRHPIFVALSLWSCPQVTSSYLFCPVEFDVGWLTFKSVTRPRCDLPLHVVSGYATLRSGHRSARSDWRPLCTKPLSVTPDAQRTAPESRA